MKLIEKKILLISPESWDHIFVSKHHYAIHLGKRSNKVFFLNPPSAHNSVVHTEYVNVFSIGYRGFPKGLRFYPPFLQRFFIRNKFNELQKLCGDTFDVVWSFDNSVFFDFSALPKNVLKICHIVDLNQNFQTRKAAATANVCFCTTELIKSRLSVFNSKVFKINHGFNASALETQSVFLPGESAIKVLYAGNLSMPYIDWELIGVLVNDNPGVDFIFVGPEGDRHGDDAKQKVRVSKNTFFVGRVKSDDLLCYYRASDILLVAYKERYHADQANPHKVMEYMASGRILVSTYTDELRSMRDEQLICMSGTNAELPLLFSLALKNLLEWNGYDKAERRKKWAMNNTYDKQIERIEFIIN